MSTPQLSEHKQVALLGVRGKPLVEDSYLTVTFPKLSLSSANLVFDCGSLWNKPFWCTGAQTQVQTFLTDY